jgi:hypothetical protein
MPHDPGERVRVHLICTVKLSLTVNNEGPPELTSYRSWNMGPVERADMLLPSLYHLTAKEIEAVHAGPVR